MGPFKAGISLLAIAVAGAAYLAPHDELSVGATEQAEAVPGEHYALLRAGRDTGCTIGKGDQRGDDSVELEFGPGCASGFADYADARYWNEEPDGSVAFVTADGSVALRFMIGDGSAYEAFGDGVPFFALVDASY